MKKTERAFSFNQIPLPTKLLWGRFLTRMGDQAWDFSLPLVLLAIFPNQLRVAATYYFIVRLLSAILLPRVSLYIDRWNRSRAVKFGIFLQLFGVLGGMFAIYHFTLLPLGFVWTEPEPLIISIFFVVAGLLSSLGTSFMDIAVANDLVPSSIPEEQMAVFNSRLRQVDLVTEVAAPFVAGFILLIGQVHLTGFYILAFWNLLSFFPEWALLESIFVDRPDLKDKRLQIGKQMQMTLWQKLTEGWAVFFREPVAMVCVAYAFLWLSVLSPHGVLLAAFLKDGWNLPEWGIGIFRGAGALFGLMATFLFPVVVKRFGLESGSQKFIYFQSGTLVIGLFFFFLSESLWAQIGFLFLILLSRIGLYGFSLGEMQIRQVGIRAEVRGQVNGFASALTGFATLFLYGMGALLPKTSDFKFLVLISVLFVSLAALVYRQWYRSQKS